MPCAGRGQSDLATGERVLDQELLEVLAEVLGRSRGGGTEKIPKIAAFHRKFSSTKNSTNQTMLRKCQ